MADQKQTAPGAKPEPAISCLKMVGGLQFDRGGATQSLVVGANVASIERRWGGFYVVAKEMQIHTDGKRVRKSWYLPDHRVESVIFVEPA